MYRGTIIGFRSWKIFSTTGNLIGPVSKIVWPYDRALEAHCEDIGILESSKVNEPHTTPGELCPCGIYAYHSLDDALANFSTNDHSLVGVGAFWGRISVHTNGFKAQYGRVLALADHKEENRKVGWPKLLNQMTEKYQIPVIPLDLLEPYGLTFGEPLGARFEE